MFNINDIDKNFLAYKYNLYFKKFYNLNLVKSLFLKIKGLKFFIKILRGKLKTTHLLLFKKEKILYKKLYNRIKNLGFYLKRLSLIALRNYEFIPNLTSNFLLKNIKLNKIIYIHYRVKKLTNHCIKLKINKHYLNSNFNSNIFCDSKKIIFDKKYFIYRGIAAVRVRLLINFFLNEASTNGYEEFSIPLLVKPSAAYNTGQLPDKDSQMFYVERDDLYLIPTAEIPLTNLYLNKVLNLPDVKMCSYSPCFRREVGSWGFKNRGLNRLHQFDKVELVRLAKSVKSREVLDILCKDIEYLLKKLNLTYRINLLDVADIGFVSFKQFDFEVWSYGQKFWLEVSSCSNLSNFQTKRLNIKTSHSNKNNFFFSFNGSGLAIQRILICLFEMYGSFYVPLSLKKIKF